MMTSSTEKKRKLIEEKNNMHITDSGAAERIMTRTSRKRPNKEKDNLLYKRKLNRNFES